MVHTIRPRLHTGLPAPDGRLVLPALGSVGANAVSSTASPA